MLLWRGSQQGYSRVSYKEYVFTFLASHCPIDNPNPVLYTDLKSFGIDVNALVVHPRQEPLPVSASAMTQAWAGLALTFSAEPAYIEITVRD